MAIEVYDGLYSGQELDAAVTVVNAVIPSTATAQNKLATEADISQLDTTVSGLVSDVADIQGDIDNILDDVSDLDTSVSTINSTITDIQGDITDIDGKIPSAATAQNQLADKEYVNSSVSTNTANYISNNGEPFTSVAALEAYSGTVTNNDYAFVTGLDASGNTYYDRYKATVSGATVIWAKEYRLNNSSFTSTQWASINSGITSGDVSAISSIQAVIPSTATSSNKLATASDVSTVAGDVTAIEAKIPSGASSSNQMATASDITEITDLIPSGASTTNLLATASDVSTVSGNVSAIEAKIPSGASSSNKLATASDITGITDKIPSGASSSNQLATASDITGITQLIPSTATTSNKLATMADIPGGGGGGIAGVQINGVDLTPDANNKVDIPMSGSMVLGVIKTSPTYCTDIGTSGSTLTGELCASEVQYADYASLDDSAFISKGTLDNVLAGMNIDDVSDEEWTFVVDDGQGGTTTITKTVKVCPTYIQTDAPTDQVVGTLYGFVNGEYLPLTYDFSEFTYTVDDDYGITHDISELVNIGWLATRLYTYNSSTGYYNTTGYYYTGWQEPYFGYPESFPDNTYFVDGRESSLSYGYLAVSRVLPTYYLPDGVTEYTGQRYYKST